LARVPRGGMLGDAALGRGAGSQPRQDWSGGVKEGSTHATLNACKCFSRRGKMECVRGIGARGDLRTHPVEASFLQVSTSFRQVSGLGNPVTQHPSLESACVGWP